MYCLNRNKIILPLIYILLNIISSYTDLFQCSNKQKSTQIIFVSAYVAHLFVFLGHRIGVVNKRNAQGI